MLWEPRSGEQISEAAMGGLGFGKFIGLRD